MLFLWQGHQGLKLIPDMRDNNEMLVTVPDHGIASSQYSGKKHPLLRQERRYFPLRGRGFCMP
jgi:hypothetical protein